MSENTKKINGFRKLGIIYILVIMMSVFGFGVSKAQDWNYPSSTPATPFGGGTGSMTNPYIISTPQHLANLAFMVNNGSSYSGYYFSMTNDIVLNQNVLNSTGDLNSGSFKSWTPIGDLSSYFRGTFDGHGYTISGVYINNSSNYQGLFGVVYDGTLQNIILKDSYIRCGDHSGGFIGESRGNNTSIRSCCNYATIIGGFDIGGIVGNVYTESSGSITACANYGKISSTKTCVGGITGYARSWVSVSYCYNVGEILSSGDYAGGIVGEKSCTISKCFNIGNVTSTSSSIGAICYGATVSSCYYLVGSCMYSDGGISMTSPAFADGSVLSLIDPSGTYFKQGVDGYPVLEYLYAEQEDIGFYYISENARYYEDWTSTNKGISSSSSSQTYTVQVNAGDVISFNWYVSSESGYDELNITLNGTKVVSNKSGTASSTYTYTVTSSGIYTFVATYSKDHSLDNGEDIARITNFTVTQLGDGGSTVEKWYTIRIRSNKYLKATVGSDNITAESSLPDIVADEYLWVPILCPDGKYKLLNKAYGDVYSIGEVSSSSTYMKMRNIGEAQRFSVSKKTTGGYYFYTLRNGNTYYLNDVNNNGIIGYNLSVDDGSVMWFDEVQCIITHPTAENPTFVVTDTEHANYQWYYNETRAFENWTSSNKGINDSSSSHTYTVQANAGDIISFDWNVSSESGYDKLNVTLNGTTVVTNKSGTASSTYTYNVTSSGTYTFVATYSKDGSVSEGEDIARITNFKHDSTVAIEGQTTATLSPTAHKVSANYICIVTYSNSGRTIRSNSVYYDGFYLGDANDDTVINAADVVTVFNHILGLPTDNFVFNAADVNRDGSITIGDVVLLCNMVLSGQVSAKKQNGLYASQAKMALNDFFMTEDGELANSLCLNIEEGEYSAIQFDVETPEGISVEGMQLPSSRMQMTTLISQISDNRYRVLLYSNGADKFVRGDNKLNLKMRTNNPVRLTFGNLKVDNSVISTSKGAAQSVNSCEMVIDGSTATIIETIDRTSINNKMEIHDLHGRRIRHINCGEVYIINNKKYFVRNK